MNNQPGQRIRALRELFGYTQAELASHVGVAQYQVSRMESGQVPISEECKALVARATGVPFSFFEADPTGVVDGALRFRSTASTASRRVTRQISQLVLEIYRMSTELAASQGLRPPELPLASTSTPSENDIEDLAVATRDALGLDTNQPVPHVTRVLERTSIFVIPLHLLNRNRATDPKTLGHDAASVWRTVLDPALIGYLPGAPGDRLRHTLSHELGHLVLHEPHRDRPPSRTIEQEADRFAGAFLLPRERATEVFRAAEPLTMSKLKALKAGWGMAIQALIMRAWHLDLITDDRRQSLYRQLSARGWRTHEPVAVHQEQPLLLHTLLAKRYGNPISWQVAEQELGLPADILRRSAPTPG